MDVQQQRKSQVRQPSYLVDFWPWRPGIGALRSIKLAKMWPMKARWITVAASEQLSTGSEDGNCGLQ